MSAYQPLEVDITAGGVIYCGDNLDQLRKLPGANVDLIYIDLKFRKRMNTRLGVMIGVVMLVSLYEVARVLQILPATLPIAATIALHGLVLLIFALIHGAMSYRLRGILIFFAICIVVASVFENLGVATGLPYGRYYFTDAMGPKLFHVPILLYWGYMGMGYLSWTLGRVILGDLRSPLVGARVITLPLVAAFIMVAWDLANDPVWATINRLWVWQDGGAYFGVPLTNFLGYYLVVYLMYQLFAIYLRGRFPAANRLSAGYWRWAIIFYALSAAGGMIKALPKRMPAVIFDPTGTPWNVSVITGACALVCTFVMGAFAVIAWVRLSDQTSGISRL